MFLNVKAYYGIKFNKCSGMFIVYNLLLDEIVQGRYTTFEGAVKAWKKLTMTKEK